MSNEKKKIFKSLDPNRRETWVSPQHPDTVFTVRAFTGVHMAFTSDSVMNQALNECVVQVTNFAAYVPVVGADGKPYRDKEGKLTGETRLVEFEVFNPSEHPTVRMSKVLGHTMSTGIFNLIWDMTTLSREESGE